MVLCKVVPEHAESKTMNHKNVNPEAVWKILPYAGVTFISIVQFLLGNVTCVTISIALLGQILVGILWNWLSLIRKATKALLYQVAEFNLIKQI